MANEEHVQILKRGVRAWNIWRKENPEIEPDLSQIKFIGARLIEIIGSTIISIDLSNVDLTLADLRFATLFRANLRSAYLYGANLEDAYLFNADLTEADLELANLMRANIRGAKLKGANISNALVGWTIFGAIDLRTVIGLDTVAYRGPSTIGIDSILLSKGDIPEVFLQGTGCPDSFINFAHSLAHTENFSSCFISYSNNDESFAQRLYSDLQNKGVRCWYAPEDLPCGAKIRHGIDEAIRVHDKLLLILSAHSVASQWVEQEVDTALEKERSTNSTVLFPLRLDNSVMRMQGGWPALIRHTRNIGDFTHWKDHDSYQKAFTRLLRDLKGESPGKQ